MQHGNEHAHPMSVAAARHPRHRHRGVGTFVHRRPKNGDFTMLGKRLNGIWRKRRARPLRRLRLETKGYSMGLCPFLCHLPYDLNPLSHVRRCILVLVSLFRLSCLFAGMILWHDRSCARALPEDPASSSSRRCKVSHWTIQGQYLGAPVTLVALANTLWPGCSADVACGHDTTVTPSRYPAQCSSSLSGARRGKCHYCSLDHRFSVGKRACRRSPTS